MCGGFLQPQVSDRVRRWRHAYWTRSPVRTREEESRPERKAAMRQERELPGHRGRVPDFLKRICNLPLAQPARAVV